LRAETRHEIQLITDDLNKLSASVDERVSRHINSTKEQYVILRKEVNTELNVAIQDISTFMQDVGNNIQEVRSSFCRSELAYTQKFAKLDTEGTILRGSVILSNKFNTCTT
jgi:ElaB/YqjD/DUF883 family membrane-anchored ribosome-binding protein